MKKRKNEAALVKEALLVGETYAAKRGVAQFEATDPQKIKVEYIYRLLVHDKLIQPLPVDQESEPLMRHKLALWIVKHLPEGHTLRA